MDDENCLVISGTNGVEDGFANVQRFTFWKEGVRDFKPYIRQGALNLSLIGREAGLKRGALYTNTTIREKLLPKLQEDLEKQGILRARTAQPAQVVVRDVSRSPVTDARIKQIREENEVLKAENHELRAQLLRFKGMTDVLHATGRLPW